MRHHLVGNYYLEADDRNFIISEKYIGTKSKVEEYKNIAYFGNLKQLLNHIEKVLVLAAINENQLEELNETLIYTLEHIESTFNSAKNAL